MSSYAHAGLGFTAEELLTALVAERLDRLADRMVFRGHSRLGIYGSREHVDWLHANIHGIRAFPIRAYVAGPGEPRPCPLTTQRHGRHLVGIDDPELPDLVDTLLIADDRFEEWMHARALRHLPPGIIIHRIYDRLPIGTERPTDAVVQEVKPVVMAVGAAV